MASSYCHDGNGANSMEKESNEEETVPFADTAVLETDLAKGNLPTQEQDESALVNVNERCTVSHRAVMESLEAEDKDNGDQINTTVTCPLLERSLVDSDVNYLKEQRNNFNQEILDKCANVGDGQSDERKVCRDESRDRDGDSSMPPFNEFEFKNDPLRDTVSGSRGDGQSDAGHSDSTTLCDEVDEKIYRNGIPIVPYGVPIVYRPLENSRSFWCLDYKKVARDLMKAARCKLPYQKILRSGFLTITSPSPEATKNLLQLETIAGMAVDARIPNWYVKNVGKISGVPFRYTDSQLLECFSDAGVIHVRRQTSYTRMQDDTTQVCPEDCIILTFRPDIEMPDTIALGFDVFPVYVYKAPPVQCYHCLRFNHASYKCNYQRRCKVCAGPHSYKECTRRGQPRCGNCDGPHAATFRGCPAKREAIMARQHGPIYYEDLETMTDLPAHSSERRQRLRNDAKKDKIGQDEEDDACSGYDGRDTRKRGRGRKPSSCTEEMSTCDDQGDNVTPRRDGRAKRNDYEDYTHGKGWTNADDDGGASSPERKIPPPREPRSPLNFFKYQKNSRDSRRRYRHGFNRYLHKLERIGVPIF